MSQVHVSFPADSVALLEMDNPPANFGSWRLLEQLDQALREVRATGTKVVLVGSSVPGFFMAHAFIPDIMATFGEGTASGDGRSWFRALRELDSGPMVSIAVNNGQAWGGGSEISWACNLRIASESATFGQPEILLGITPGLGGASRLARLVGESVAMALVLDGSPITSTQALTLGLVHRVVPDDNLLDMAVEWGKQIASRPALALQACKRLFTEGRDLPLNEALRREQAGLRECATQSDVLALMSAVQQRYDAGEDSYAALGIARAHAP